MKTYGQYCSIARALDLVGDRWTLLLVRELLVRGPCRYTDLKQGLPGVAANLLAVRLKELEGAGLVTRHDAPPPVATQVYELTEDGAALEPVLKSLGQWGLRYMTEERPEDAFQPTWLAYAASWFTTDADPTGAPAHIQLVVDDEYAVIELGDGKVRSRTGRTDHTDLTLAGSARAVLGVVLGMTDLKRAKTLGLSAKGRRDLLARLQPTVGD